MLFVPTTQILARNAQQRMFDGVRFDGPIESDRPVGAVRTAIATALERVSQAIAPTVNRAPARHVAA